MHRSGAHDRRARRHDPARRQSRERHSRQREPDVREEPGDVRKAPRAEGRGGGRPRRRDHPRLDAHALRAGHERPREGAARVFLMRALAAALVLSLAGALPAAAREEVSTPALWRALRPNGGEAFYLIGSVHLGRRSLWRYPRAIDDAYRRSAELVLETGADELRPEIATRLAERYARIVPPATLRDRVSPATIAELSRYLAARHDSLTRYLQMEPWFVAQQIEAREAQRTGLDAEFGIDRHFA